MSNGEVCCILGVCCPPESAAQLEALVNELTAEGCDYDVAEKAAKKLLKKYEFAPAGSLTAFKADIAKMARAHK